MFTMQLKDKLTPDRIIGSIFIVLGIASFIEGVRLRPMRMLGGSVGDDTLPMLLGIVMFLLGSIKVITPDHTSAKIDLPKGRIRRFMIYTMVMLFLYVLGIEYFGYFISTFLCAVVLFKVFGEYRWIICFIAALLLTFSMYLIFAYLLKMPFPIGMFGF